MDVSPSDWSIFIWWSCPALAIALMVSAPIAVTICWNLLISISVPSFCFLSSISFFFCKNSISALRASVSRFSSASLSILAALARRSACSTFASPSILAASARDSASALACPVDSSAALWSELEKFIPRKLPLKKSKFRLEIEILIINRKFD